MAPMPTSPTPMSPMPMSPMLAAHGGASPSVESIEFKVEARPCVTVPSLLRDKEPPCE